MEEKNRGDKILDQIAKTILIIILIFGDRKDDPYHYIDLWSYDPVRLSLSEKFCEKDNREREGTHGNGNHRIDRRL